MSGLPLELAADGAEDVFELIISSIIDGLVGRSPRCRSALNWILPSSLRRRGGLDRLPGQAIEPFEDQVPGALKRTAIGLHRHLRRRLPGQLFPPEQGLMSRIAVTSVNWFYSPIRFAKPSWSQWIGWAGWAGQADLRWPARRRQP